MKVGEVWKNRYEGYWVIIKAIQNDMVDFTIWPMPSVRSLVRPQFVKVFEKDWEAYELFRKEMEHIERKVNS